MAALSVRQAVSSGAGFASPTPSAALVRSTRSFIAASCLQTRRGHVAGWVGRGRPVLSSQFAGVAVPVETASSSSPVTRKFASRASPRSALVQKVTARELDAILTHERTSPMIIDFYATWCGPCVVLAQDLELLALEYGQDIRFLKVDTDEEHELASQMEIRGLPTMVFVSTDVDKLAIRTEGLLPLKTIRDIIEKEILVREN